MPPGFYRLPRMKCTTYTLQKYIINLAKNYYLNMIDLDDIPTLAKLSLWSFTNVAPNILIFVQA